MNHGKTNGTISGVFTGREECLYQLINRETMFIAGQMTGVEGYVESAASGLIAGINAGLLAKQEACLQFPKHSVLGSMAEYITTADFLHFQPMNANFGLLPPLATRIRNKKERYEKTAERAILEIQNFRKIEPLLACK